MRTAVATARDPRLDTGISPPARSMYPWFSGTHIVLVLLTAVLSLPPHQAGAKQRQPGSYRTFLIYYENDLFAGTDQHYTSAVKLSWLTKDLREYREILPEWVVRAAERIPFVQQDRVESTYHNVGFSLGQNIYTPDDTARRDLIPGERPYAGWLYGSLALHRRSATRLDTFETTLGIIGPSSLAEQSQNTVHRYRDLDEAEGWKHQLKNEPGLILSWQQSRKALVLESEDGFGMDLIPHVGMALGNVFTYVNIGGEMRFGYNLPTDFGTAIIRPGSTLSAPVAGYLEEGRFGMHCFFGVDGRLVARNIFLEGNTWKDSHRVDKRPFVADLYAGLAVGWDRFKLTYTHAFRSKEFEGQDANQLFGSISLRYAF